MSVVLFDAIGINHRMSSNSLEPKLKFVRQSRQRPRPTSVALNSGILLIEASDAATRNILFLLYGTIYRPVAKSIVENTHLPFVPRNQFMSPRQLRCVCVPCRYGCAASGGIPHRNVKINFDFDVCGCSEVIVCCALRQPAQNEILNLR